MENYKSFEKKIVPYLDGSLSTEEASEFEAFVFTHPEFENKIKSKQQEVELLRSRIPVAVLGIRLKTNGKSGLPVKNFQSIVHRELTLFFPQCLRWVVKLVNILHYIFKKVL